jgi:ADP-heptose:LPS heptosyltransferase/GT2 family glycosyltransferase
MSAERDRERKIRHEKIKKALAKKPSKSLQNKFGITPDSIKKINTPAKQRKELKKVIENNKRERPLKAKRTNPRIVDVKSLANINTPYLTKTSEYPTPDWFRTTEKVNVSVIIPLYRSSEVIKGLIRSWDFDDSYKIEIIFVDDYCPQNSKDVIVKNIEARKKHLNNKVGKIFCNLTNLGFGPTCNVGAHFATGDYLIFLNADTIVTKNWIPPIIELLKNEDVGIVGNLQIKKGGIWDGSIDSAGSEWSWASRSFLHIGRHIYAGNDLPQPYYTHNCPKELMQVAEREMVTGCCLAIRKELFDDIGGFNPNYKIGYWEDSEICMNVRERGYKILFQPKSKIYHMLSHSKSGSHAFQNQNTDYFMNKWVNSGRIDKLVSAKRNIPDVRNITIKRRDSNGDVLLASSVCPALKKMYPHALIHFDTNCKEVLKNNPYIDGIINEHEKERPIQLYYNLDMCYEQRPKTNILKAYAEAVGVEEADCKLFLDTSTDVPNLPEKYIVIHSGSTNWAGRNWSTSNFDEIARRLKNNGHYIVCVGRGDHLVPCDLDLRNKTNISQLSTIIKNANLFVGIDSFPFHVAQTFDTPTVCFFGSILPETRIVSKNVEAVNAKNLACIGCHHRKPAPSVVTNTCETKNLDCINLITTDTMWSAIERKLNANDI